MVRDVILLATVPAILLGGRREAPPAEREVSLVAPGDWLCLFGGRRTELELTATSSAAFRGAAGWSLAVSGRTVTRGETALAIAPGQTVKFAIPLDIPEVREGVVLSADLAVQLFSAGERPVSARLRRQLSVFSEDAFAGRSKWLETLQIRLFDPAGKTRDVFEKTGIPFFETGNVESLARDGGGLLVIGEGVSLEAHRGLPGILVQAAAQGTPVLCLAPADGRMALPGSAECGGPNPERVALRRGHRHGSEAAGMGNAHDHSAATHGA